MEKKFIAATATLRNLSRWWTLIYVGSSIGGAEYFLTFIDDYTRYVWVYPLKTKDQVFDRFVEWRAMVEKSIGQKLKTEPT